MCFFDQYRFACGDWKWGHFRQHCAKEYHMGHTCGMKLVMQTIPTGTKCKLCEKIETKMRRRNAEVYRIGRWQRQKLNCPTSIEKSKEIIRGLDEDIYELGTERAQFLAREAKITIRDQACTPKHGTSTNNSSGSMTKDPISLSDHMAQNFIASFVEILMVLSGGGVWSAYTRVHMSSEDIENAIDHLLRDFGAKSTSPTTTSTSTVLIPGEMDNMDMNSTIVADTSHWIQLCRSEITRSLCDKLLCGPVETANFDYLAEAPVVAPITPDKIEQVTNDDTASSSTAHLIDGISASWHGTEPATIHEREQLMGDQEIRKLAYNMQQMLYRDSDATRKAIMKIMKGKTLFDMKKGLHTAIFNVDWPLVDFIKKQYGIEIPPLGKILTVSGSALYAQAQTCSEYVEARWPAYGEVILRSVNDALQNRCTGRIPNAAKPDEKLERPDFILETFVDDTKVVCSAVASTKDSLIELGQVLAWLGSAIRSSPYDGDVAYCVPMLVQTNPTELEILFRHARVHPTERACWMPLFDGVVIAAGFPVATRGDELGLEISVDLLAALAGAQHVVDYRDSAMMKGYSHLFVPVKKRLDSVQWHMIVSPDAGRRVKYEDSATLIASGGSIAKVSIAEAASSRAFVGWCSNVESRLGSEAATYDNVDYSQAEEATDAGLRCLGGSLGFQQMGIAQVDVRFGAKDGKCHFQRKGTFRSVAQAAESTLVTLYDTGEKRAWLVPASQVILHVIQYRQKLALYSTEKLDTHVESNVSGMDVLIKNRSICLSHDEEHSFQDETLIIWSILDWLLEQNVARYQRTEGISIETSWRDHLFGFEFKAIVQNRTPLRLKRTEIMKTNGGWPVLVQEVDSLVLFADGFGDVLVPSAQGHIGLCRRWERVPRDCDFLSTTGNIMLQLYDEAGSRLNRLHLTSKSKLRWHQGSSQLFEPCENAQRCGCERLQQLFAARCIGTVVPPSTILREGAVIFGRKGFSDTMARSGGMEAARCFYSIPNAPLNQVPIAERLHRMSGHVERTDRDGQPSHLTVDRRMESIPASQQLQALSCEDDIFRSIRGILRGDNSGTRTHHSNDTLRSRIDRAMDIIRQLDAEILELSCERARRLQAIGH